MAKTNLGLSMEVDITFTNTGEKEASKLVKFLESHGIEELSRTKTAHGFLSIELTTLTKCSHLGNSYEER